MIPIFFKRYKKAPLATCISFLSTASYAIAAYLLLGYILNWDGLQDDGSVGEIILIVAVFVAVGFGFMKLAERLADRKQKKLAEKEAASVSVSTAAARAAETLSEAYWSCPVCGTRVKQSAAFCTHCGASREGRTPATPDVSSSVASAKPASSGMDSSLWETPTDF